MKVINTCFACPAVDEHLHLVDWSSRLQSGVRPSTLLGISMYAALAGPVYFKVKLLQRCQ